MLDGVWWPKSRNPEAELPELILAIEGQRGQVIRLVLAATGWDERPRRMVVAGRTISIDYFGSQPATLLTAICARSRVDLLVIPPASGQHVAAAAMVHAMSGGNRLIGPRRDMAPDASSEAWQSAWEAAQHAQGGEAPHDSRPRLRQQKQGLVR